LVIFGLISVGRSFEFSIGEHNYVCYSASDEEGDTTVAGGWVVIVGAVEKEQKTANDDT